MHPGTGRLRQLLLLIGDVADFQRQHPIRLTGADDEGFGFLGNHRAVRLPFNIEAVAARRTHRFARFVPRPPVKMKGS
jgi:hypothetical protein